MDEHRFHPSIAQLRAFVAIADRLHFRSAADALNVSQPSLSQALAALENGLGVSLIERNTRRVLIAPAGERLLEVARRVVAATDTFADAAAGTHSPLTGSIRLGLIPTVAPYLLPQLLPILRSQFPDLVLRVVEDQTERLVNSLKEGSIDAAILALPLSVAAMELIPLYEEPLDLAVPAHHPLAGRDDVSTNEIATNELLLLSDGHCLREHTLEMFNLAKAPEATADTRAASLSTVVRCVAGGLGVAVVPRIAAQAEITSAALSVAKFDGDQFHRKMVLAHRKSTARVEELELLGDLIADVAAGVPGIRRSTHGASILNS